MWSVFYSLIATKICWDFVTETSLGNPEITFFDLFCETQGWCSCRDVFPIRSYHGIAAPDGRDAPHTSTSFRTRGGDYHQPGAKRCCCCFGNAGHEISMCLRTVYHLDTLIYIYIYIIYSEPWLQETRGDSPWSTRAWFLPTTRSTTDRIFVFLLGSVGSQKKAKWLTTPISKKSPTGPTVRTPNPEYLIALAIY